MGHIRLGRLPKTRSWSRVFQALTADSVTPQQLAGSVAIAAQKQFSAFERDEAINYCFWVLVRIATASRGDNFAGELQQLRISGRHITSGLAFVQQVGHAIEKEFARRGHRTVFGGMAELSLKEVLSTSIIEQSRSLFGTGLREVQAACRTISTQKRFGELAKEFFAKFMSRSIRYLTDKEFSNHIRSEAGIASPREVLEFQKALDRYCLESAKIVEEFAAGWFSKHNWETNNDIPEDAAAGFTSYALNKIQTELRGEQR
jgi:hypothetical protein